MKSLLTICLVFLMVLGCAKQTTDQKQKTTSDCTIPGQTVKEGQEECTCPEGQEVVDGECSTYTLGIPTTTESSQEKGSLAETDASTGKPLICGPPQNTPYGYTTIVLDKKWKNEYKVHVGAIVSLKKIPNSDTLYTHRSVSPGPQDEPGACFYVIQADASSRYMMRVEQHSDSTGIRSTIDQSQKSTRKLQLGTHLVSLVRENGFIHYKMTQVLGRDMDEVAGFKRDCCLEVKLLSPSEIKLFQVQ